MAEQKGFKGISFPFRFNSKGGVATSETSQDNFKHIDESIIQIIRTNELERINEPHMSSEVQRNMFNTPDENDIAMLQLYIKKAIRKHEKRVEVKDVRVNYVQDEDHDSYYAIEIVVYVSKYMKDHTVMTTLRGGN